jgi:NADH dehydrogenase
VVIGGGLEGIEALGEILRGNAFANLDLTLVEARDRLLPEGPAAVSKRLQAHCTARGVDVLSGDAVAKITAKTVFLNSGRRLPSDLTIWTGGPAPPALLADAGLAAPGAWARVHDTLQHNSFAGVFIAGDSAALSHPLSKQAYHALDMGRQLAANIRRAAGGRRLRAFRPAPKPTLLAFGDIETLLIQGDFAVAGPALAAAKEAVFTAVMTQLDQRAPAARLQALLSRGRNAGRTLLWPALSNADSLLKQTKVVRVT